MNHSILSLFLLVQLYSLARNDAFTPAGLAQLRQHQASCFFHKAEVACKRRSPFLFQSSDNSDPSKTSKRRRKRTKRREESVSPPPSEAEAPTENASSAVPELKPREDAAVKLQVQDVRDLVGGGKPTASASSPESFSSPGSAKVSVSSSAKSSEPDTPSTGIDDALQMLLQDAKEMQALEKKEAGEVTSGSEDEGFSIPDTFKKVLSTIVTVDFFVVCGFLLWFLAGIFCSYVLKDDTVQISFNRKFYVWYFYESFVSCVGLSSYSRTCLCLLQNCFSQLCNQLWGFL
jgi:hypothetical protein